MEERVQITDQVNQLAFISSKSVGPAEGFEKVQVSRITYKVVTKSLTALHSALFSDIYDFAGIIREVNIAKENVHFAPRIFLEQPLDYIDRLPHQTFDEIVDMYTDMNIAHPFREGNGRSMRIWLDCMFRASLKKVVDWNSIDKDEYFNAMIRSHVSTGELKYLLLNALTDDLGQATFFKGIDHSYYYEGYNLYRTEGL